MIQSRKAAALHNHCKALADLPIGIFGNLLLAPFNHFAALFNGFVQTAGADRNNIALTAFAQALEDFQHIAFFHMVLLNHILVVNAELFCKLCHCHHDAVVALRRTIALICTGRRRIGIEDLQIVGHVIDLKERKRLGAAIHRDGQAMVAVRSGVRANFHIDCRNGSVLFAAHLDSCAHGMTGGVCNKLFLTGISVVNGLAGNPRGIAGKVFDQDVLLAAVAAADSFLNDMDLILGNSADPTDNASDMVGNLRRAVENQSAALHMGIAHMRLQRCVLDLAGLVGAVYNRICLRKALLHIADAALVGCGNILTDIRTQRELIDHIALTLVTGAAIVLVQIRRSACVILDGAVMNQRSALCHGFFHGINRCLRLIYHMDQLSRFLGNFRCSCNDTRNAVADMAHLLVEQAAVMRGRFGIALAGLHIVGIRAVERGNDRGNAVQLFSLGGIDGFDIGTCERTSQNVKRPCVFGHLILNEYRLTGNQSRTVDFVEGFADDIQIRAEGGRDFAAEFAKISQFLRQLDREVIVLVTGITDEDTGQRLFDIFPTRIGLLLKQPSQNQCGGRCIIRTLYNARGDHGLLNIIELSAVEQGFCGSDFRIFRLIGKQKIGIFQLSVKNNRIGAGKAFCIVTVSDRTEACAVQHISQAFLRLGTESHVFSVNSASNFHLLPPECEYGFGQILLICCTSGNIIAECHSGCKVGGISTGKFASGNAQCVCIAADGSNQCRMAG